MSNFETEGEVDWQETIDAYMAKVKRSVDRTVEVEKIPYLLSKIEAWYTQSLSGSRQYKSIMDFEMECLKLRLKEPRAVAVIPITVSDAGLIYGFTKYIGRKGKVVIFAEEEG